MGGLQPDLTVSGIELSACMISDIVLGRILQKDSTILLKTDASQTRDLVSFKCRRETRSRIWLRRSCETRSSRTFDHRHPEDSHAGPCSPFSSVSGSPLSIVLPLFDTLVGSEGATPRDLTKSIYNRVAIDHRVAKSNRSYSRSPSFSLACSPTRL